MAEATIGNISCSGDISNLFSVAQYHLNEIRDMLNGRVATWEGMIPDGGRFPVTSNFASRVTTLAQQRLGYRDLNLWQPMVALQGDCAVTCDPPVKVVNPGNANHQWYRLMNIAYNTTPYCLESMFASGFDLPMQIEQIYKDLFMIRADVMDEFYRNNQVGLSAFRWLGYDPASQAGGSGLFQNQWQFATDANGFVDTRYIVLNNTINPDFISLPSTDILNRIRNFGIPMGTFPEEGQIQLVTDYELFSNLPLYDTNRREDNRFRAPGNLDPSYVATTSYAGYKLKNDIFMLRYNWRGPGEVPGYPNGVLERVYQWTDEQITEGCFSQTSQAYIDADFCLMIPWSTVDPVFMMQNGEQPLSAGSGVNFAAVQSPWDGTWRWFNEVNEVTPCNSNRNKGYWGMVLKKAAKPIMFGQRGHVLLARRFPLRGITRSCATLRTGVGAGSADCTNNLPCPAPDFFPPSLVSTFTCGGWNEGGTCAL
jgi:hypothetical protein